MTMTMSCVPSMMNVFPKEQYNQQESFIFVKKLVSIAVSHISFLRGLFPDDAFCDKGLGGAHLKILKENAYDNANQLLDWLKGSFDALEKKYLRQMIISFYQRENDPECLLESYKFKFSYVDGCSVSLTRNEKTGLQTMAQTKRMTHTLLRTILLLAHTLQPLPDSFFMSMKLLYYDDITPPDYQPPGFKDCKLKGFFFETETMNIQLGEVDTQFHKVMVRVETDRVQFDEDDEMDAEETVPLQTSLPSSSLDFQSEVRKKPVSEKKNVEMELLSPEICPPSDADIDNGIRCACGLNEDDGLMILCTNCSHWQHAVCFSILHKNEAPDIHICNFCSKVNDLKSKATDPTLTNLNESEAQTACIWRRTLIACLEFKRICLPMIEERIGVDKNIAEGLLKRLLKEGFLKVSGKSKKTSYDVDKNKIKQYGISKYFIQIKEREQCRVLPKEKQITHDPMTDLLNKTDNLNLTDTRKSNWSYLESTEGVVRARGRPRKRAFSKVNHNHSFDVVQSQEPSKKSKFSVVKGTLFFKD